MSVRDYNEETVALPDVVVMDDAPTLFGGLFAGLIALLLVAIMLAARIRRRRAREGIYEKYRLREDLSGGRVSRRRAAPR